MAADKAALTASNAQSTSDKSALTTKAAGLTGQARDADPVHLRAQS